MGENHLLIETITPHGHAQEALGALQPKLIQIETALGHRGDALQKLVANRDRRQVERRQKRLQKHEHSAPDPGRPRQPVHQPGHHRHANQMAPQAASQTLTTLL